MSLSSALSPKKTENKDAKNHHADDGIELVPLSSEADCCKGDANERIDQQQDNTDHDEAATVPDIIQIKGSLKHRKWVFEILGLSAEDMVTGRRPLVGRDKPNQTSRHNGCGHENPRQHHPRQRVLELGVVH
jgi:hypothetical protein